MWEADIVPARVCQGDRVGVAYKFPINQTDWVTGTRRLAVPQCDAARLPRGQTCADQYPVVSVRPGDLFSRRLYPASGYEGVIQADGLLGATPVEITVAVDPSSPNYTATYPGRSDAPAPPRLFVPQANLARIDVAESHVLRIDPIDTGGMSSEQVTFAGQCAGGTASWVPLDLRVGESRSASVHPRRICNREAMRSVRYLATFTGAPASMSEVLAPGACLDLQAEVEPYVLRSISVIPSADPTQIVPLCRTGSDSSPPPPVRAELTFACP